MASDGGHFWPTRAADPRVATLTGGGTTPDDVFQALRTAGYTGSLDDMWKAYKVANAITDISEPWDGPSGGGGGSAWPDANTLSFVSFQNVNVTNLWDAIWNDDGTRLYCINAANGIITHNTTDFAAPYAVDAQALTQTSVTNSLGGASNRSFDWLSDGTGVIYSSVSTGVHAKRLLGASAPAYNPTIGGGFGFEAADAQTFDTDTGWDSRQMSVHNGGKIILTVSNDTATYSYKCRQIDLGTANDLSTAVNGAEWNPTDRLHCVKFDPTGNSGYALYDNGATKTIAKFTCSTQWDISTVTLDTVNTLNVSANATGLPVSFLWRPDGSGMYVIEWTSSTTGGVSLYE